MNLLVDPSDIFEDVIPPADNNCDKEPEHECQRNIVEFLVEESRKIVPKLPLPVGKDPITTVDKGDQREQHTEHE